MLKVKQSGERESHWDRGTADDAGTDLAGNSLADAEALL